MKYYIACGVCGHKLFKAGDGSNIEIICPKCNEKLNIEVKDGKIMLLRTAPNKTNAT
jgi:phage FluMu protein Com